MSALLDPTAHGLGRCGCCDAIGSAGRPAVFNRPGLSAIAYRDGTWYEVRKALIAALATARPETGAGRSALRGLTTRSDEDLTIALLDALAVVADVETFYNERIATETFLRTASEPGSVMELARLIGFDLRPGAAAEAYLAFTIEPAAPAGSVRILSGTRVQSVPGQDEQAQTFETVEDLEARASWSALTPTPPPQRVSTTTSEVWFDGLGHDLRVGDALLFVGSDGSWSLRRIASTQGDAMTSRLRVRLAPVGTGVADVEVAGATAYVMRTRAAIFGHNAPDWTVLSDAFRADYLHKTIDQLTNDDRAQWPGFDEAWAPTALATRGDIELDGAQPSVLPGGFAVLAVPGTSALFRVVDAQPSGMSQFGISATTTRVRLQGAGGLGFSNQRRQTLVLAGGELLPLASAPVTEQTTVPTDGLSVDSDVADLPAGRTLVIAGVGVDGQPAGEAAILDRIEDGHTLRFREALRTTYRLAGLLIFANAARATHGETVEEILGSGDAGKPYQRFQLKQRPLTYVQDSTAGSGAASTLGIRVNDVAWHETASFFGTGPMDHRFTGRPDPLGATTVRFGDGVHGARLPTGVENLRAHYRKGIGAAGNVRAGTLTTLLTRPLGVKEVVNPSPATGGADADPPDVARRTAPVTVLTLDRVVSLRDHEDFARSRTGFAKALATWSWDGQRRGILLTVAGTGGVDPSPDQLSRLEDAIRERGDPWVPLRVVAYGRATFSVAYDLLVDPDRSRDKVERATVDALRAAFSFDARDFGQAVALAEVIAVIQATPGVIAVDVNRLVDGSGTQDGLVAPLVAAMPGSTDLDTSAPAQLLVLSSDAIVPGRMS